MISIRTCRPSANYLAADAMQPGLCALVVVGLACHKGNAADSQSSTQIGSQGQGVSQQASTSSPTNTGTAVVAAPVANGNNNSTRTGGNDVGAGSTITTNTLDDGAVGQAITALKDALNSSLNSLAINTQAASQVAADATAAATAAASGASSPGATATGTAGATAPGVAASGTAAASLTGWQMAAALTGIAGSIYLILRRKKA